MSRARGARAAAVALLMAGSACTGSDRQPEPVSQGTGVTGDPASRLLADSAAGDSAAFATLPPSLRAALDIRDLLTPAALADTARTWCQPMGDSAAPYRRRRLRFRRPDTLGVLFVRADRATGSLQRVELVRRPLTRGFQHGFSWDASDGVTREINWVADQPTAVESGPLPGGGPAPRALRGLGRLLLAAPCTGARRP